MTRVLKAAGVLIVALCISMIGVIFFESVKALFGEIVAMSLAFLIAAALAWQLAKLAE